MMIREAAKLYRYDIVKPPTNWSGEFKNPEYSQDIIDGYTKNDVGSYFFFSNEEVAINTAQEACRKRQLNGFYLTQTEVETNLKLLNLCGCSNTLMMVLLLHNVGIDIFNNKYKIYTHKDCPFLSELKDIIMYNLGICESPLDRDAEKIQDNNLKINEYLKPFGYPFTILGQTLMDYANGIEFKKELISKGFDGYCFDESIGGHTLCLLNADHLSNPNVNFITIQA